jgi:hypothetical protein
MLQCEVLSCTYALMQTRTLSHKESKFSTQIFFEVIIHRIYPNSKRLELILVVFKVISAVLSAIRACMQYLYVVIKLLRISASAEAYEPSAVVMNIPLEHGIISRYIPCTPNAVLTSGVDVNSEENCLILPAELVRE